MSMGERLKKAREKKGLSREDLGKYLGVSYSTISKYETDEREPSNEILIKICKYLDISADYLLGRSDDVPVEEIKASDEEIISTFPSGGNPMNNLPEPALKELEHYTEYLYQKWKGWKPGDPPR